MCSSYVGEGERERSKLRIAEYVSCVTPPRSRVILLDDLVDSGATLGETRDWLLEQARAITEIKTGVVFKKTSTEVNPDYYAECVDENRWIFLPNEALDRIDLNQLPQKALAQIPDENLSAIARIMLQSLPTGPMAVASSGQLYDIATKTGMPMRPF